jgi:hypothetical protein
VYKRHEKEKTITVTGDYDEMSKGKIRLFLSTCEISRTKAQFRIGTDKVYDGITYKLSSKGKRKK